VDRELGRVRLFLQHEQYGLAAAVGPFDQQRHVQLPKPIAEPFLQLLLTDRDDAHTLVHMRGLGGGEELHRVVRVVDDQVLEVLVVAQKHLDAVSRNCGFACRIAALRRDSAMRGRAQTCSILAGRCGGKRVSLIVATATSRSCAST
jgi:hypothetical protein